MDNNDLKKLNRKQLLELLLKQAVHVEELEKKVDELERKLNDKQLTQQKLGSIAEASLKVNGVFEAAEAAAAQYVASIKAMNERVVEREAEAVKKIQEANEKIIEAKKKIEKTDKILAAIKERYAIGK